ncbi:hypothetical protein Tco_0016803 [Tanacetum coccineum]
MTIIGTKWVYRNKLDENNVVSRNKARIVRIKRLLDDLEVTAVKLVLLVQKLLLLVWKVNAAGIKVTTTERLQLLKG